MSFPESSKSLSCRCLNIRFDLTSVLSSDGAADADDMILGLFTEPIYLIKTEESSNAQIALSTLVSSKQSSKWNIFTCFNCKTCTHATSLQSPTKVLLNGGALLERSQQESIKSSDVNYSQLYAVLTFPTNATIESNAYDRSSVLSAVYDLETRAASFLDQERASMEKRIKDFESEQLARFQDLKQSVATSRQNLANQMRAVNADDYDDADSAFERSVEESFSSQSQNIPGKCLLQFMFLDSLPLVRLLD